MSKTLQRMLYGSIKGLKRSSPMILTCMGALGVVATAVMAVKATPKALYLLENERGDRLKDDKNLSKRDIVRVTWKCYVPSALSALATITCIFSAHTISEHQQKAITGAYLLLDQSFKRYKDQVKNTFGEDAELKMRAKSVANKSCSMIDPDSERQIFYEEHYDRFFERTKTEVINAEYQMNQLLLDKGYADLNDFYGFLEVEPTETGACLGWSLSWLTDCNEKYGYSWIDFKHEPVTLDNGMECTVISYDYPPTTEAIM